MMEEGVVRMERSRRMRRLQMERSEIEGREGRHWALYGRTPPQSFYMSDPQPFANTLHRCVELPTLHY